MCGYISLMLFSTGTCVNMIGTYFCQCESEYTGKYCDVHIDPCQHRPCHNFGICMPTIGQGYSCVCLQGMHGCTSFKTLDFHWLM